MMAYELTYIMMIVFTFEEKNLTLTLKRKIESPLADITLTLKSQMNEFSVIKIHTNQCCDAYNNH